MRDWGLLPVGAGEFWKLVIPMNVIFLYIINHFVFFSHLGFHVKLSCALCMM
jgi:hypothetical protein